MQERILRETQPYIEAAGGHKEINRVMGVQERAWRHFLANEERYLEEYPGKWIVVTVDGVVIVGDDQEEVFKEARRRFAPDFAFHIHFMDPEPQSWLLCSMSNVEAQPRIGCPSLHARGRTLNFLTVQNVQAPPELGLVIA